MDETKAEHIPMEESKIIRIWDDPESRIHFLETVLKGKEWEAVVYHPNFAPDGTQRKGASTPLPELQKKLATLGYETSLGQDENGIPILNIRNFGHDTTLNNSIKELGFVKGMTHKITHIGEPLGNVLQKTADMVKHVATDKARLVGGIYLVGDVLMFAAAFFNKDEKKGLDSRPWMEKFKEKMVDPANQLQSVSGILATLQSVIYMKYAEQGSEAMYSELMKQADQAREQGVDLLSAEAWKNKHENNSKGLLNFPNKLLRDYPLQMGALSQIAGQVALMASGGIRLRRNIGVGGEKAQELRQGAVMDMATGALSVTGWSLLTKTKPKKVAEEDRLPWSDPRRVWQEMSANPNQFASGFLAAATIAGYIGGEKKKNPIQKAQNATYLMGDGVIALTNSEHYGAEGMSNSAMLAEAADHFIKASPMILGEKEQGQLVEQLSAYLAERHLYEAARKSKHSPEVTDAQVSELGWRIAEELNAKLPKVNHRANEAAKCIAGLVRSFNPTEGAKLTEALCDAICDMEGVVIDKEELKAHVLRQTEYPKEPAEKLVKMEDIAKPMANLVFAIPGAATPASVDKIYSIVDEHVRPEPLKGKEPLERAINDKAARDVSEAMGQQKPQPVPVGVHTAALNTRPMQGADITR